MARHLVAIDVAPTVAALLALALGATGVVRAWFSQPHLDVPPPFWMVAVPALDLTAAAGAAATAIALALAWTRRR